MKHKLLTGCFLLFAASTSSCAAPLGKEDVLWLNRVTYGINSRTAEAYQSQGKTNYLNAQLSTNPNDKLPEAIEAALSKLLIEQKPADLLAEDLHRSGKKVRKLPDQEKIAAQRARLKEINQPMQEAIQRHLLRALYSPAQIKEQMVWFWLNHFSIFRGKGEVRWLLADYEESAIRPHALGKFRDLLMATVRHPAMLLYLDNSRSVVGKINENYARELMELHTLGVDGGYTQQDVQELSRILTGLGVSWNDKKPKLKKELRSYYLREGNFEFNPNRHDFGKKQFLGHTINGEGFAEVEQVVDKLASHPSTARFISRKLAVYFVADSPSPALIDKVATTFQNTSGDIPATLHTLIESKEFADSLGKKISDPMHYLLATLRFAYDGEQINQVGPLPRWLNLLGAPLYGHMTPDGYGMTEKDWVSPAQLTKRFEIVKQITGTDLVSESAEAPMKKQKLADKQLYQTLQPLLSEQTKAALDKAVTAQEWNIFLLSSPEFTYR
jgi:uncharacterized protein (DUF1800 family)